MASCFGSNEEVLSESEFTQIPHELQRMVAMGLDLLSFAVLRKCSDAMKALCEDCERSGYLPQFDFEYSNEYEADDKAIQHKKNGGCVPDSDGEPISTLTEKVVSRRAGKVVWEKIDDYFRESSIRCRKLRIYDRNDEFTCFEEPPDSFFDVDKLLEMVEQDWKGVCSHYGGDRILCRKPVYSTKAFNEFLESHEINELSADFTETIPALDKFLCVPAVSKLSSLVWHRYGDSTASLPRSNLLALRATNISLPCCDLDSIHAFMREWKSGSRDIEWLAIEKVTTPSFATLNDFITQLEIGILSELRATESRVISRTEERIYFMCTVERPDQELWVSFYVTLAEVEFDAFSISTL